MNKFIYAVAALCFSATSANAIVIDSTTTDGNLLVNEILGSGITIDTSTITYLGADDQSGIFSDGLSSGIGIDSGIIMSTGSAYNAVGPNTADNSSVDTPSAGDAQLSLLSDYPTYDAAVLEFDFTSTGGDIYFNFVFASEEYNEWVDSPYNDVFAFWVDGVNIALAPDSQEVAINTVNCGDNYVGFGPNCEYYNNNDLQDGGPYYNFGYDGFTDMFTAALLDLAEGTHSMKFAIADASDSLWDSAVFIQAKTFSDEVTVPEPASILLLSLGLLGLGISRKRAS